MTAADAALDDYLVWELCKQHGIRQLVLEPSPDRERIKELLEEVRQDYRATAYDRDAKLELLQELDSNPEHRLKIAENCSWTQETVSVENLGTTLPHAGDLPPAVIAGTLPDVVQFVRTADPDDYWSVTYIRRLKDVPAVLDGFRPWVVTPGNAIRQRERMRREHGEKDWDIAATWGALNDGNHRTIAKLLANDAEEIECYVGHLET